MATIGVNRDSLKLNLTLTDIKNPEVSLMPNRKAKFKHTHKLFAFFLMIIINVATPVRVYAMVTPGPQMMEVIISNPPADLTITIIDGDETEALRSIRRAWEVTYRFALCYDTACMWRREMLTFRVEGGDITSFYTTIEVPRNRQYFSVRLNIATQTVTTPPFHLRNIFIFILWFVPLIALDSSVFHIFGFKKKESWNKFLRFSIIIHTLFILNWFLLQITAASNWWPFMIIIAPPLLFIKFVKVIGQGLYIQKMKEHPSWRNVMSVLTMTILSIVLIALLMTHIPLPRVV